MPIQVSYPGVYIEEIPSGQPLVAAVSTASTAFIDFFSRGPMNEAVQITNLEDFNRIFGGLHLRSESSYGLRQYFTNGGQEAWVIRATDGTAVKAYLDVTIETPGLQYRVDASFEDFQRATKAASAAVRAAQAANTALQELQVAGITDQEMSQKTGDLQSSTSNAAEKANEAAAATRAAALQAKASSDELALAIAKAAAASGPVADRTAAAADEASNAAEASADAAKATSDITGVAQQAAGIAEEALRASQGARDVNSAATDLQNVLLAGEAAQEAAQTAASEALKSTAASVNLTNAKQAANRAAASAQEAAAQAENAAQGAVDAAQAVVEKFKAQDDPRLSNAQQLLEGAQAVKDAVAPVVKKADDAAWDAQIALDLEDAQTAAWNAEAAAQEALWLAVDPTLSPLASPPASPPTSPPTAPAASAQNVAVQVLSIVLAMAAEAAETAAAVASSEQRTSPPDSPNPLGPVIEAAVQAINDSIDAARKAVQAAQAGSQDAKVAADSVASGGPAVAARSAEANAAKLMEETAAVVQQAKAVRLQVANANITALESVKPADDKAADARALAPTVASPPASPPLDLNDAVKTALDTAQAALNAADNSLAAAKSVEDAAVATSEVSVQASKSADGAAQAAEAAVMASEEASRPPTLKVEAISEGVWGNNLEITIKTLGNYFSFQVRELVTQNGITRQAAAEQYAQLTLEEDDPNVENAVRFLNHYSNLVRVTQYGPKVSGAYPEDVDGTLLDNGDDGGLPNADQLTGADGAIQALDKIEPNIFNILCLPSVANLPGAEASVAITNAKVFCGERRAFFIVDVPADIRTPLQMLDWVDQHQDATAYNMGVYFPRLIIPDPLQGYRPRNVGPSGTLAGIYSRTDTNRGVWKAPAGIEAVLEGAEVALTVNDTQNGDLNQRGVNVLRSFPIYGNISWGARTLAGADLLNSEWKYINVRRLMNFVEQSIFQSLKWAVFEPNNEILWGKIRLQIASFLGGLFADGAFQGPTPAASYFVRCDGTTTTPLDIDMGIVNVMVGIAPVKPAEFIILQFQQIAGQAAA